MKKTVMTKKEIIKSKKGKNLKKIKKKIKLIE